jgi:hypothetical protein
MSDICGRMVMRSHMPLLREMATESMAACHEPFLIALAPLVAFPLPPHDARHTLPASPGSGVAPRRLRDPTGAAPQGSSAEVEAGPYNIACPPVTGTTAPEM